MLREEVCDDIAVKYLGHGKKHYSSCILKVMEEALRKPAFVFIGIGFIEKKNSLGERIRRIMKAHYTSYKPMTVWSVIVLVVISVLNVTLACEKSMDTIQGNESTANNEAEKPATAQSTNNSINIEIIGVEKYMVNNKQATATDLAEVLKDEIDNGYDGLVMINGDSDISTKDITFVMDTAYKIGVKGMALTGENIKELGQKMVDEGLIIIREPRNTKQKSPEVFQTIKVGNGKSIEEGTDVLTLNGESLTRGTDYTINYKTGEVAILNEKIINPKADFIVKYKVVK